MHKHHSHNEQRTLWVLLLTAGTMVVEIVFGILTRSMSLLADGIHMGSHVLAIGLAWLAYVFIRKLKHSAKYAANSDNILALAGYTSAILLLVFAGYIIFEAIHRFIQPEEIAYKEAIIVACSGLVVNILSAVLLHHKKDETDHNIKAAYLHVIADAITSLSAIIGLIAAMIWKISFVDTIAAIISSLIILRWSIGLIKDSGKKIIDFKKN